MESAKIEKKIEINSPADCFKSYSEWKFISMEECLKFFNLEVKKL
jgi:hypothetical protein